MTNEEKITLELTREEVDYLLYGLRALRWDYRKDMEAKEKELGKNPNEAETHHFGKILKQLERNTLEADALAGKIEAALEGST